MAGQKLLTFAQWREAVVGQLIDIDGAYGAQCWDLWAHYAIYCHGATAYAASTSGNPGPDRGLASSLWLAFPAREGIDAFFVKVGRDATPREGDGVVWARSAAFPDSHVAIATGRTRPGQIEVVSQNDLGSANTASGATRVAWLTTGGLLGFLRPIAYEGDDMPTAQEIANAILGTQIPRQGKGQTGNTSLRAVIANIDALFDSVPGRILDVKIPRKGGSQSGETTLRAVMAHTDALIEGVVNTVTEDHSARTGKAEE